VGINTTTAESDLIALGFGIDCIKIKVDNMKQSKS
jgi:hypothetical protein